MFNFLKNKLKEWVSGSKEKLKSEEKIQEIKKEPKRTKPKKQVKTSKKEKIDKKADKLIEKAKEQKIKEVPKKFDNAQETYLPDIEEIKQEKKSFLSKLFTKKQIKETLIETPKETPRQETKEIQEEKQTFLQKLKSSFIYKITEEDFNLIFEDLEMLLLENNVAIQVTEEIKSILSKKLINKEIKKEDLESEIKKELKETLNEILIDPDNPLEAISMKNEKPFVVLFFGINGTGKTTSIAKFANLIKSKDISVVLAAADTFRAASIEQISEHAKKLEIPIIKQEYGSDPAAVGFDAIKYAKAHGIDVVLIDTAGRMHTKSNLISEMEKIVRVTNPDLKIFVAEAIAGNDATEQARTFNESIQIDGTILSKADIDEKGGTIISISSITKKPIFYLGTGQKYEDLKLFNKEEFIKSLGLD